MLFHDIERSILELTLRKSDLQKEIDEIDLQIAFLCEQKKEAQEDSWQSGTSPLVIPWSLCHIREVEGAAPFP